MRTIAAAMLIVLLVGPPPSGQVPSSPSAGEQVRALPPFKPPCFALLRNVEAYDGDTINCDILLPLDVTLREQRLRLRELDAWEISRVRQTVGVTDEELVRGRKARDELRLLLAAADRIYASDLDRESAYGRVLGRLWVDPAGPEAELLDVARWMRERGHDRRGGQ